jgi:hypothetical protein
MTPPRSAAALLVSLLLLGLLSAQEKQPRVVDLTPEELWKDAQKYHGKVVRLVGVVELTPEAREDKAGKSGFRYGLMLAGDVDISIHCDGKPTVAKGDKVRITGAFTYTENSFVRRRLAVDPPLGQVEKITEKQPEPVAVTLDELGENRKKYHGKLVRVEVTVPKQVLVMEKGDKLSYALEVGTEPVVHLLCAGKPDCKEGDRLRVTGRFDYLAPTFARLRIDAAATGGQVEKLPALKK